MGECRQLAAAASSLNMEGNALTVLIIGMGAYLLAMIIIGLLASRKISGISDFIVAGRRLPLWMATATMMAHSIRLRNSLQPFSYTPVTEPVAW